MKVIYWLARSNNLARACCRYIYIIFATLFFPHTYVGHIVGIIFHALNKDTYSSECIDKNISKILSYKFIYRYSYTNACGNNSTRPLF